MGIERYRKLVRDRIPEIIEASGKICKTEVLSGEEYLKLVDEKLKEELSEYYAEYDPQKKLEELADLVEVIYAAAQEVNDFRTTQFLDWFIKEQGEEEKNSSDLITRMELFGDDARSLYMLNSELAGRTYSAPSLVL